MKKIFKELILLLVSIDIYLLLNKYASVCATCVQLSNAQGLELSWLWAAQCGCKQLSLGPWEEQQGFLMAESSFFLVSFLSKILKIKIYMNRNDDRI